MSAPAPPDRVLFPPQPTNPRFWPQIPANQAQQWSTQQDFDSNSRFIPDFPQFSQPEFHPLEPSWKKPRNSEEILSSSQHCTIERSDSSTLPNANQNPPPIPSTVPGNPSQRFHNPFHGEYGPGSVPESPPIPGPDVSAIPNNRGISRMFFKTRLCSKFKLGTCPYSTNCNFAHGDEEIRKPPPNWQQIIAAHEDDRLSRSSRREESPFMASPFMASSGSVGGWAEQQRINRLKICKKFYNGGGCPYGDKCTFLHEEPARPRETVGTTRTANDNGNHSDSNGGNGFVNANGDVNGSIQKPVYWKTRICNKWETTGYCPFGDKCHFAHGLAELQKYGGGFTEAGNGSLVASPSKLLPYSTDDISPNQRSCPKQEQGQSQGQKSFPKWKGPTKINRIYADWIDDSELVIAMPPAEES